MAFLPALPATLASGINLLHGGQDGGAPWAACVFNAAVTFPLGTCSSFHRARGFCHFPREGLLAVRWAWLGQTEVERRQGVAPPQPCTGSDIEHGTLLRVAVLFPEGCALVLAFPLTGSDAGRWARSREVGEECSQGRGWADTPQECERGNARQRQPGCGFRGGSAFFLLFLFYFKSRLSLKINMVF